ncbi:MAG TPA: HAMP domain-containing sensor histidine kinase [Candidatus Bathyarchaeia archaeon]|nr:HAMP domain-containing sensor histidine kinase [Candidatus Bathyarchaeia archaeon]
MELVPWFETFTRLKRQVIIDKWLKGVEEARPGRHDPIRLRENGEKYYDLLIDLHIPVDTHPQFSVLSSLCEYHAANKTPVTDLLQSSHLWRRSLIDEIYAYIEEQGIEAKDTFRVMFTLHTRIDMLQNLIAHYYWNYAELQMQKKDATISQLHDDRLSMLGKMAASMAHELRNPLFAIDGFLKLIKSSLPPDSLDKVAPYLGVIDREFSGLYGQISAFLSFSRNEKMEERWIECRCGEMFESVLSMIKPRAINENVELLVLLYANPKLYIQKVGLQQVLSNLLNNSLDALSEQAGSKQIHLVCQEDHEHIYIRVKDNGPGIPDDLKEDVFTPFVTSKQNGTGLGLAICKQIAQKNRGDITFTSRKGETIFTLQLQKQQVPS